MDKAETEGLLAALPVPVLLIGAGGKVQVANPAAVVLFGPDVGGRQAATFLRQPAFLEGLETCLVRNAPKTVPLKLPGKSATELKMLAHLSPARDLDGRGGVLASFEDQTNVEQAEAMRRDFVANVSHELRTPLTALVGFIETLKGPARDDSAARERFLGIMQREAGRMIRLVNDLLSLSRVEAEERRRPSDSVDVMAILRSVQATLRPQAEAAGLVFEIAGEAVSVNVPADADQLVQVFHNLAENAIKYGASGGLVRLAVTAIGHDAQIGGPAVQVAVEDHGEGIEPMHLPRLTERFYRVDTHRSRDKGGTGLGLAIVKHIVNRHRGRLKIESAPGKGSRFIVLLPTA